MCVCVCVCTYVHVCDYVQLVVFLDCSQHKWTPLFAAAWGGHRDVVMYLLEDALCDKEVTDVVSILIFNPFHCFSFYFSNFPHIVVLI